MVVVKDYSVGEVKTALAKSQEIMREALHKAAERNKLIDPHGTEIGKQVGEAAIDDFPTIFLELLEKR